MNKAQILASELPPETQVKTDLGTICINLLADTVVMATSGADVGWMRVDGRAYYAAARITLRDGVWTIDETQRVVCAVVDGKAGPEDASFPVRVEALALLRDTVRAWAETHPELLAEAKAAQLRGQVFRLENEIRHKIKSHEEYLSASARELAGLRTARKVANREAALAKQAANYADTEPRIG